MNRWVLLSLRFSFPFVLFDSIFTLPTEGILSSCNGEKPPESRDLVRFRVEDLELGVDQKANEFQLGEKRMKMEPATAEVVFAQLARQKVIVPVGQHQASAVTQHIVGIEK